MPDEIWYEEDVTPRQASFAELAKKQMRSFESIEAQVNAEVRGKVIINKPDWERVTDTSNLLTSNRAANFYRVRLGFQFELTGDAEQQHAQFVYAVCAAELRSKDPCKEQPRVYEMFPLDYYDADKPPSVNVALGGSLGNIGGDVRLGQLEPVVVGYPGKEEREPRWELRPKSKKLVGVRYLWLLLQVPHACAGARLALRAEGDIQTRLFGRLAVGPKEHAWDRRPSILIS